MPGNYCVYNRFLDKPSVSRSLKLKEKAQELILLLELFLEEVSEQNWISDKAKKKYQKALLTQIGYHAAVYDLPICISIPRKMIALSQIKGWHSRFKIFRRFWFNSSE